jgi:hypothetical protein
MIRSVQELKALSPNISFPENWMELMCDQLNVMLGYAVRHGKENVALRTSLYIQKDGGSRTFDLTEEQADQLIAHLREKGYTAEPLTHAKPRIFYTISGW